MFFSQADQERITTALRELLANGIALDDALRELHEQRGVGIMWLVAAVEEVCAIPKREAQQRVVQATKR